MPEKLTTREYGKVELADGNLHFIRQGNGKPLILLHSLGVSVEAWLKVTPALAASFSVYALDMMGHADSDKPKRDYGISDFSQNVFDFMKGKNINRTCLIGNSIGATIAADIAASRPELVEKLVLVGCPGWETEQEKQEAKKLARTQYDDKYNPIPRSLEDLKMHYVNVTQELQKWVNNLRGKAGVWAWKSLEALYRYDTVSNLKKIKCPALLVYGEKDLLRARENVLKGYIKGSKLAIISGAAHLPQMDNPSEFLKVVQDFLK